MTVSLRWCVSRLLTASLFVTACSSGDRPTAPRPGPEFAISDAVHEGGTPGFYFLPPMVAQPTFGGTFDADITTLNPAIAICDVTNDANCGTSSGTLLVFTTTSTPAITIDVTTPQYQVNWNTQAAGFVAGHTYRVHVTAGASGARRELGFADVLLTTTPGQAKFLQTGDVIVLQDGRTLPIHFRIEIGIACDCWSIKSSLANARTFNGAGVANGMLYAVGGIANGSTFVVATEAYDPVANAWTAMAPLPAPQVQVAVGVVNNTLYAVGGSDGTLISGEGHFLGTVEAYDPTSNTWNSRAPMPTPRRAHAIGVVNGVLYAVGGLANGSFVNTVEAYDPTTDRWTTKAPMPTPRAHSAVGVVNGILYVVGGCLTGPCSQQALGTVEAYDPTSNTWTTKAPMPTPRAALGIGVVNGVLYAVGGFTNGAHHLNTVEAYDQTTDTWSTKSPMPTPRDLFGAVGVLNGVLYAVGGSHPPDGVEADYTGLATVEAYQP